jgi:predicted RNase H-like nuclease (RuvC/YqgF family)
LSSAASSEPAGSGEREADETSQLQSNIERLERDLHIEQSKITVLKKNLEDESLSALHENMKKLIVLSEATVEGLREEIQKTEPALAALKGTG